MQTLKKHTPQYKHYLKAVENKKIEGEKRVEKERKIMMKTLDSFLMKKAAYITDFSYGYQYGKSLANDEESLVGLEKNTLDNKYFYIDNNAKNTVLINFQEIHNGVSRKEALIKKEIENFNQAVQHQLNSATDPLTYSSGYSYLSFIANNEANVLMDLAMMKNNAYIPNADQDANLCIPFCSHLVTFFPRKPGKIEQLFRLIFSVRTFQSNNKMGAQTG